MVLPGPVEPPVVRARIIVGRQWLTFRKALRSSQSDHEDSQSPARGPTPARPCRQSLARSPAIPANHRHRLRPKRARRWERRPVELERHRVVPTLPGPCRHQRSRAPTRPTRIEYRSHHRRNRPLDRLSRVRRRRRDLLVRVEPPTKVPNVVIRTPHRFRMPLNDGRPCHRIGRV